MGIDKCLDNSCLQTLISINNHFAMYSCMSCPNGRPNGRQMTHIRNIGDRKILIYGRNRKGADNVRYRRSSIGRGGSCQTSMPGFGQEACRFSHRIITTPRGLGGAHWSGEGRRSWHVTIQAFSGVQSCRGHYFRTNETRPWIYLP